MPSDAPAPSEGALAPQNRLHPLTLAIAAWNVVRWAIGPFLGLLVFGGGPAALLASPFIYVAIPVMLVPALVRYFSFTYRFEGGDLVIRQGVIERTERHIPIERIQDLRTEQGFLHRLLGVTDVQIQTAGGEGPEASLSVLSLAEAQRLRLALADRGRRTAEADAAGVPAAAPREVVRALGVKELVLAGLTSNRLAPALALLGAAWAFADDVLPGDLYERGARIAVGAGRDVLDYGVGTALLIGVGVLAAFTVLGALLSAVGSVVLFYNFTLSLVGDGLHREYGLITHRSMSLRRRRIQLLQVEQGLLRRLFGLATLRADTAGGRDEAEQDSGGRDVLLPAVRCGEVDAVLPIVFPDLDPEPAQWRRVAPGALVRGMAASTLIGLGIAAAALWYLGAPRGYWAVALLPALYAADVVEKRRFGYAVGQRYLRVRSGLVGLSTHIVPVRNIQAVVVRRGPLDRLLGMATVVVDTAGERFTSGVPRLRGLPVDEAFAVARDLARRAAATRYR
jgi:putative membrane protein